MSQPSKVVNGYKIEPLANLWGADLYGADLEIANLRGANLRCAYLYCTVLYGADLKDVNLRDANLRGADLEGTGIHRVGERSDGYEFYMWNNKGVPWVKAGCRYFSLEEGIEHWTETRGGTPLFDETMKLLEKGKGLL